MRVKAISVRGIAMLLFAVGICFTVLFVAGASASENGENVEYLGGEVHRTEFRVEEGHRVIATSDLQVICSVDAEVDGLILGDPGVTIEIISPSIIVRGTVRGGDGENRMDVLENGQDGGNVILDSPYILLQGAMIRAGTGGNAGPSGHGGNGGDVSFVDVYALVARGRSEAYGGDGGRPGDGVAGFGEDGEAAIHGGAGGHGGSVSMWYWDVQPEPAPDWFLAPSPEPCASGIGGDDGLDVYGGNGISGANGANGTTGPSPTQAGDGAPGGPGGSVMGGDGKRGADGDDCCPDQGGYGGDGGKGGYAIAGDGGDGGNGGEGAFQTAPVEQHFSGGDGGNGGNGGIAWWGWGGDGGHGGDGCPPGEGGDGGATGEGSHGHGGDGGDGGDGCHGGKGGDGGDGVDPGSGGAGGNAKGGGNCQPNINGTDGEAMPAGCNVPSPGVDGNDGEECCEDDDDDGEHEKEEV